MSFLFPDILDEEERNLYVDIAKDLLEFMNDHFPQGKYIEWISLFKALTFGYMVSLRMSSSPMDSKEQQSPATRELMTREQALELTQKLTDYLGIELAKMGIVELRKKGDIPN